MATNPMQRKARNSFLMGMLVMLLISGVIIALLVFLLINAKEAEQEREGSQLSAYVLQRDLRSGESISVSDLKKVEVPVDSIPVDYLNPADLSDNTITKIALARGTVVSKTMLTSSDEKITSDIRLQEYNMLILPVYLDPGEYIDVRLTLPNGQDYIVISKKRVIDVMEHTIWLELSEVEIQTMTSAIVETYIMTGSNLYVNKYVEPGIQQDATPTYPVNKAVLEQIESNPNIAQEARNALRGEYNSEQRNNRLNSEIESYGDSAKGNVETKIKEQNDRTKALREKMLDDLSR